MKAKLRSYSGIPDNNQEDLISFVCGGKYFWEIRLRGLPAAMNSIRIGLLVWAQDGEKCFPGKMIPRASIKEITKKKKFTRK